MRAEHRKEPRVGKQLEGTAERVATILHQGQNRVVKIHLLDVSHEGVGFVSPEPFDKSAFVRLAIETSPHESPAVANRRFVTSVSIRNCAPRAAGAFEVQAEYRVGAVLKEQTGREWESWNELVRGWSRKVM